MTDQLPRPDYIFDAELVDRIKDALVYAKITLKYQGLDKEHCLDVAEKCDKVLESMLANKRFSWRRD